MSLALHTNITVRVESTTTDDGGGEMLTQVLVRGKGRVILDCARCEIPIQLLLLCSLHLVSLFSHILICKDWHTNSVCYL